MINRQKFHQIKLCAMNDDTVIFTMIFTVVLADVNNPNLSGPYPICDGIDPKSLLFEIFEVKYARGFLTEIEIFSLKILSLRLFRIVL